MSKDDRKQEQPRPGPGRPMRQVVEIPQVYDTDVIEGKSDSIDRLLVDVFNKRASEGWEKDQIFRRTDASGTVVTWTILYRHRGERALAA
jgi:hypothetical protein